ncbi:hypothetical protein [Streptomyces sp. NBC_01767]|uniref:hypothetical protein n=1 Tax=Streptomyces sp. NBC_01767 TaxID=2975937 RepID=UPI0022538272|nr:hypothetical protein [Streptomyces sp. NBC_01767]MCX4392198.1 hypothetical protein [Streptomyces sp. NBC_01767]
MKNSPFRGRRTVRLTALLMLAGGPLVGCGIQETAVIEAGRPAVADLLPPREERMLLFFLSPDDELRPVPRTVEAPWQNGIAGSAGSDDASSRPDEWPERDGLGGSSPPGAGTSESPSPLAAVTALLAGPERAERRAGFHNAASLSRAASAANRIVLGDRTVEVMLRLRVKELTAAARGQIVCTAAFAAHAQGAVSVTLVGQDGRLAPADCPVRPVRVPTR